jgi:predicted Zn finger-like uncharacterized protein
MPASEGPELIGLASAANQTKRLCCRYGFRFVNAPVVASSRSVSEVREPSRLPGNAYSENTGLWQPRVSRTVFRFGLFRMSLRQTVQERRIGSAIVEIGSMHIICPHCTTSYGLDPATLGQAGRTVRCSRCKQVWLARPEDATEMVEHALAAAGQPSGADDAAAEWDALAREDGADTDPPMVESPSISGEWPDEGPESSWPVAARHHANDSERGSWIRRVFRPRGRRRNPRPPFISPSTACAAMGALVMALVIWRIDVVRLLPQTAAFYSMVGLEVNLRGLMFKDVKISTETVEGKSVLVIEGAISGGSRMPVELPRLRFSVRDAQGAEIYAWNAVLEQHVLQPGERALFKSRLASPPAEGRNIDIRFFNKRDLASGSA